MKALPFIIVAAASNFIYQWIFQDPPNWTVAVERSYFQALAVGLYTFLLAINTT